MTPSTGQPPILPGDPGSTAAAAATGQHHAQIPAASGAHQVHAATGATSSSSSAAVVPSLQLSTMAPQQQQQLGPQQQQASMAPPPPCLPAIATTGELAMQRDAAASASLPPSLPSPPYTEEPVWGRGSLGWAARHTSCSQLISYLPALTTACLANCAKDCSGMHTSLIVTRPCFALVTRLLFAASRLCARLCACPIVL